MAVYDLFSKRARDAQLADKEEVYQYEEISAPLRVQIRKILTDGLGKPWRSSSAGSISNSSYAFISQIICREYGLDELGDHRSEYDNLMAFINRSSTQEFLDALELGCRAIDRVVREQPGHERERWGRTADPDALLDEVNYRLRRAGVGYQYVSGEVIRVDSQLIHSSVVKPALTLLQQAGYAGPQAEFLSAYEHLRAGRNKEAITDAAKSFESMMKAICDRKGWPYPKGARATDLLKILRTNKLWPDYLDGSFDQLIATLSSGLPQVRNDTGAHGQGAVPTEAPEYVAAYALHLAAAKMVLLGEAAAQVPDKL